MSFDRSGDAAYDRIDAVPSEAIMSMPGKVGPHQAAADQARNAGTKTCPCTVDFRKAARCLQPWRVLDIRFSIVRLTGGDVPVTRE